MIIIILMLILLILFAIWMVFSLYELAILFLVNLIFVWLVGLRVMHDLRNKKNAAIYLVSMSISLVLFMFKDAIGLDAISRFLSKFMIVDMMQIILLVFVIAQLLLILKKK